MLNLLEKAGEHYASGKLRKLAHFSEQLRILVAKGNHFLIDPLMAIAEKLGNGAPDSDPHEAVYAAATVIECTRPNTEKREVANERLSAFLGNLDLSPPEKSRFLDNAFEWARSARANSSPNQWAKESCRLPTPCDAQRFMRSVSPGSNTPR